MSASHLNKSPLLGNNLIEGECIAKEGMCSTENRLQTTTLAHWVIPARQCKPHGVLASSVGEQCKLQDHTYYFPTVFSTEEQKWCRN